jgi:hypothetical protein
MVKLIKCISLLFVISIVSCVSAQIKTEVASSFPKTLAIDGKALQKNYNLIIANDVDKVRALKLLLIKADKLLKESKLYSVMDKKQMPPSGDKHDYMSTGPYWWPDQTKPDGLPYIKKDGLRNPTYYDISDSQEINKPSKRLVQFCCDALGRLGFDAAGIEKIANLNKKENGEILFISGKLIFYNFYNMTIY